MCFETAVQCYGRHLKFKGADVGDLGAFFAAWACVATLVGGGSTRVVTHVNGETAPQEYKLGARRPHVRQKTTKAYEAQMLRRPYLLASDADGTRTRNHRIDSPGL